MNDTDLWQRRAEAMLPIVEAAVHLVHGGMRPYATTAAPTTYTISASLAETLRAAVDSFMTAAHAEAAAGYEQGS